jgi:hypothetical protein
VRIRAEYVLACDGARSPARKLLGLDFPGSTYDDRFLIADVRADLPFPPEPRFYFDHPANRGSTVLVHPQPGGVWRIDWQLGSAADLAAERAPAAVDRRIRGIVGAVPYELVWLSDYRFHQRQLDRLRHGRVFFLGDAAHLVSPFGARGLNSAIHDVENLGWKLAAVLRGESPEPLLDTYQAERWPAQRHDQEVTDATMRFMAPRTRAQRLRRTATLRLSAHWPPARRWVDSGTMSAPFTYRGSPVVVPDAPSQVWGDAPEPGAKAPDAVCAVVGDPRPSRLRTLLGWGFVALYFAVDAADARAFAAAAPGSVTVRPVLATAPLDPGTRGDPGALGRAYGARPGTLFLLRPDGHVAARRRRAGPGDLAALLRTARGLGPVPAQVGAGRHSS